MRIHSLVFAGIFTALTIFKSFAVVPTNPVSYIPADVTFTLSLTIKSSTPRTFVHTNSTSTNSINTPAFADSWGVFAKNGKVVTQSNTVLAANEASQQYGTLQFLSDLATNGILPDKTPQGWMIMATPVSTTNVLGQATPYYKPSPYAGLHTSYAGFYAAKKGQTNIDLTPYMTLEQLPLPISYSVTASTNYLTNGSNGNISISGIYNYEGPVGLVLYVPAMGGGTNTYFISGLLKGTAVDYIYQPISTNATVPMRVTIPGAFTITGAFGAGVDTNNNAVVLEGSLGFGSSKAVVGVPRVLPTPFPTPTPNPMPVGVSNTTSIGGSGVGTTNTTIIGGGGIIVINGGIGGGGVNP